LTKISLQILEANIYRSNYAVSKMKRCWQNKGANDFKSLFPSSYLCGKYI